MKSLTKFIRKIFKTEYQPPEQKDEKPVLLRNSLDENLSKIKEDFGDSDDLVIRRFVACKHQLACVSIDNMVKKDRISKEVIEKITEKEKLPREPSECFNVIFENITASIEQKEISEYEELYNLIMSGWVVLLIEGVSLGVAVSSQGFESRNVDEPNSDVAERGSKEAFNDVLQVNVTLIRRRMKTNQLTFKYLKIGKHSNTSVALCYLRDTVSPEILKSVTTQLQKIKIDNVMASGYLQPFLEKHPLSLFSTVGTTERPDVICGKISEGRIAVIVDGTPFVLVVPFLFSENFQNMDDYTLLPAFVTFIRVLKYLSFFISLLLPGIYVAISEFNPEIYPPSILYKIMDAEVSTPFPLVLEAIIIHVIFEILREAGLRLPRSVGNAVSIVGALVIGEAAVTAGFIGAPMIMIVSVTALSAFVVPSLYYSGMLLRFSFIIVGGLFGIFGMVLLLSAVFISICSLNAYGIPYTAPITPFDISAVRDTVIRAGWRTLSRKSSRIQNLDGSNVGLKNDSKSGTTSDNSIDSNNSQSGTINNESDGDFFDQK